MHDANKTAHQPQAVLVEDALFELDNGSLSCGRLDCAGQSAHLAGRTLAGQRVRRLTRTELQQFAHHGLDASCECCGMTPDGLRPSGRCAFCAQSLERGVVCATCQEELA